uniref:SOWAHA-C winged helix-turn-helix domain-containing protein n=1 Tax=Periophthalmus magnuspinnatus TaxID=409849 RepID=A0A3B3ZXU9_9GOBI
MAVELTQDAVLYFLQSRGGSVTNAELLLHFRPFLREHANRDRNRELFKRFVNSVARVKQEDGVSYVVLQQKFRGQVHGVGSGVSRHSTESAPTSRQTSQQKLGAWTHPRATRPPAQLEPATAQSPTEPCARTFSRTGGAHESPQESPCDTRRVPLEEHEHLWLVKAAEGTWPDIYSLFREEPSLLHRRDFISGFTVLHWIAKHGDHRVLNTLWYGVEKAGMAFDTDAQSSCGYTPLHIAAIHNHKNIIRLLVNKFGASVSLRDAAGKKAWSYLPQGTSSDLFELLGAPVKAALGQTGVGEMCAAPQIRSHSQKRRRRHHFSSASQQRPLTVAGDPKVKRTSSLAAFLKHKPLQKVKAEWAI